MKLPKLSKEHQDQLAWEYKNRFYYLVPEHDEPNWWLDREGKLQFMPDMGLDHLIASIRLIEKHLDSFTSRSQELQDFIRPLAERKLAELKAAFKEKSRL